MLSVPILVPFFLAAFGSSSVGDRTSVSPPGELGYQPPEVLDVRVPDTVLHQDTVGGSLQTLLSIAGAPERGFAAVWRDTRDGTLGLYFARLDEAGLPREPERSICQPHTMRRTDAVVALGPDGRGAVAWTAVVGRGAVPFVRGFDGLGALQGAERVVSPPVEASPSDPVRGGRGDEDASCREPSLVVLSAGRVAVVWTRAGRLQWLETTGTGDPLAPVSDLDRTQPPARPGVRLAVGPADVVACAWSGEDGLARVTLKRDQRVLTSGLGRGEPRGLATDPSGGYWCLLSDEERARIVHLAADGKPDRESFSPSGEVLRTSALAAFPGGVAVLEAPVAGAEFDGPLRLWLFSADGLAREGSPLQVTTPAARGPSDAKLASSGARLLVAWTDLRDGHPDVYGRVVDTAAAPATRLGPEHRINTDGASANQTQTAIASASDRGAAVWVDERASPARVYVRRFGVDGLQNDEIALPLARGAGPAPVLEGLAQRPAVSVGGDGAVLVVWRAFQGRGRNRLVAQLLEPDGTARTGLFVVDEGSEAALGDPACTTLPLERGFAIAWPRGGKAGVRVRQLATDGTLGPARDVAAAAECDAQTTACADVDIAVLESGRVFCAWTRTLPADTWSLRGRFLSETLAPLGDEIGFEPTPRHEDWDPAIAPAHGGGFVLSWTSGSLRDPVRDAVARLFDGRGKPSGPLQIVSHTTNEQDFTDIVRLADGSFAVAWEDDISYFDQVYVRRLSRDGRTLGPMMRINAAETEFLPDRVAPRLAPLGNGFAAVFADRHRSLGFDALFKVVGNAFDVPAPTSGGRR